MSGNLRFKNGEKGQAVLEYVLLVVMLATTVAVLIRNNNRIVYRYWTGLANQVALPSPQSANYKTPPDIP